MSTDAPGVPDDPGSDGGDPGSDGGDSHSGGGDPESREGTPADGDGDRNRDPPLRVEVYPGKEAVVEFDPDLTFECVDGCTWCCHHGVLLYDEDYWGLAERADLNASTTDFRGERFVRREKKDREEHVAEDGSACYFLTDDGLCALHDEHDWKPARCSVFPLAVRREGGEVRVDVRDSAREHCDGLGETERRVVDNLPAFLPELLWELPDPDTRREL